MQAESSFITCRHGAGIHQLHMLSWGEEGVPVICVHALTRVAGDFTMLAQALAPRRVYAPEMIGRGESPWLLDSHHYSYPHYVDDCVQFLKALPVEQVDWVGTSMGGLIGMMIAGTHPGRIRKLVLNDVGPFLPLAGLQRIGNYLGVSPVFADFDQAYRYCRTVYAPFGLPDEAAWQELTKRSIRPVKSGGYRLHYDPRIAHLFKYVRDDVNLWSIYEQIKCPTLVLRGATSDVLREEDAQAMSVRGPKAQLVTFPDCGHAPGLESAEQIRVVREFLS